MKTKLAVIRIEKKQAPKKAALFEINKTNTNEINFKTTLGDLLDKSKKGSNPREHIYIPKYVGSPKNIEILSPAKSRFERIIAPGIIASRSTPKKSKLNQNPRPVRPKIINKVDKKSVIFFVSKPSARATQANGVNTKT